LGNKVKSMKTISPLRTTVNSMDVPERWESLRVQLVEVHDRAKLHADRLWQLPFSYIGIIGISFSLVGQNKAESEPIFWLFIFYVLLGVLAILAMLGAIEAITRALRHMIGIENDLGLEPTTRIRPVYQFAPYLAVAVLGLVACVMVCVELY